MSIQRALMTLGLCLFATCLLATTAAAAGGEAEQHENQREHFSWRDHHRHHGHFAHHGGFKGGFLGVSLSELTPELRAHFGVPEDAGVMVAKVVDDSPASRAGIQVGDIISAVDSEPVSSSRALARAIRQREDGAAATLEIWRDRRVETLTATLEEREGHRFFGARAGHGALHGHDFDYDFDHDFDCGEEECDVSVRCEDGDCECSINGESVACVRLHEKHHGDR